MRNRTSLFNLRHIEVFRAVMRLGTVTAAADALGTSQPTVTREIGRLESQVGFALFERKGRRLHPTARAKRLFQHVQATFSGLADIGDFVERLREADGEVLTIATLPAFAISLLPGIVARMHRLSPGLSVEIQTTDPRDMSPVSGYDFDLGLIEGTFFNPAVETTLIAEMPLVAVLPVGHPALALDQIEPADLARHPMLSLGPHDPSRLKLHDVLAAAGVDPRILIQCQSATALCEMVALGLGIAIVNPVSALYFLGRGLQIRRFQPHVDFRISILRPLDRPRLEACDLMVDLLRTSCRERMTELAGATGR